MYIFSDKEATVRELKSLGCDLEKEYVQNLENFMYVADADVPLAFGLSTSSTCAISTQPIRHDATPVHLVL
jgi:hypothetical protein